MDFDRLWFLLKEKILEKDSWGKNMLIEEMSRLEIEESKGDKI